jgi:hypothetical protein
MARQKICSPNNRYTIYPPALKTETDIIFQHTVHCIVVLRRQFTAAYVSSQYGYLY